VEVTSTGGAREVAGHSVAVTLFVMCMYVYDVLCSAFAGGLTLGQLMPYEHVTIFERPVSGSSSGN